MTTPTTTHDLAIARAERDAWQSTCEELHRTIAGRDVEIEAHLGRCEAADQRARSLDAALTAEREAGKGLVAQVEAFTEAYIKTKHGGKAWPGEEADRRGLTAQFRATFAALGPVTLPSPDRAEELCRRYHDSTSTISIARGPAWSEYSDEGRAGRVSAMHKELTALAKLSPDPAPTFDTAFLRRVMVATKHGPNGKGGPGPCDAACVKCEAERMVATAAKDLTR